MFFQNTSATDESSRLVFQAAPHNYLTAIIATLFCPSDLSLNDRFQCRLQYETLLLADSSGIIKGFLFL